MSDERRIDTTERREVPWLSVLLGYGPMLPLVLGAAGAWLLAGPLRSADIQLTLLFAATILAFLAGVRRGLSFRTAGGPTAAQIGTMLALFILALASLACLLRARLLSAAVLLAVGFTVTAALDPIAARTGEAPLFFARLRPTQMPIAAASLVAIAAALLAR